MNRLYKCLYYEDNPTDKECRFYNNGFCKDKYIYKNNDLCFSEKPAKFKNFKNTVINLLKIIFLNNKSYD